LLIKSLPCSVYTSRYVLSENLNMKNLNQILIVAIITLFTAACKKDAVQNPEINKALIGTWKLNASFLGTGYAGTTWQPVAANDNHTVVFNANGTVAGNEYPDFYKFAVKDSLLTFNDRGGNEMRLIYTIKQDTLFMSPGGKVICIEGCAVRFIKQ
jgi:hypothetical protein